MEKNTRKMSKGNLGVGVGLASLILSGCLVISNEREINDLTNNLDRVEEKAKQVIAISEGYKQENNLYKEENKLYKVKISELTDNVNTLESENTKLKKELKLDKLKKERVRKEVERVEKLSNNDWMDFTQTHYVSFCDSGCTGETATGISVKNTIKHEGMSVIAVDPKVIPLGSIVEINNGNDVVKAIAIDTGGAIKGRKIDFLVSTHNSAYANSLGVKKVKVKIIRKGWAKA